MGYVRTDDPDEEPVSLAEAKVWCRVDGTAEDAAITGLISAAREAWEGETRRSFVTQTWRADFSRFPCAGEPLRLPWGPVQEVTSVSYYADDGTDTVLDSDVYEIDLTGQVAKIWLAPDQEWPTWQARYNAVRVTYVAGFGTADEVPNDIKLAISATVALWYDSRDLTGDISGICGLLSRRKVQSLA